jgi:hypothetical protein
MRYSAVKGQWARLLFVTTTVSYSDSSLEFLLLPQLRTHISQRTRDTPNFLYAALDTATCAPFIKERRMKFAEPAKLHRKSGIWGTLYCGGGEEMP